MIPLWRYRHYKNKDYELLYIGKHSDTLEDYVVYQALYESEEFWKNMIWVKPLHEFIKTVVIDGQEIPRFAYIWG